MTVATKSILVFLVALTSVAYGKGQTPASEDSTGANSLKRQQKHEFTAEMGICPWNSAIDWRPSYSVRLGLGTTLANSTLFGYLEYYKCELKDPGGLEGYIPNPAIREDVALYAVVIMPFFELGFGAYYTKAPQILDLRPLENGSPVSSYLNSASNIRLFVTFGIHYEIHLSETLFIPLVLSYRGNDYGTDTAPWIVRAGIGYLF